MTTKYNCWKVISEDPDWTVWELDKSGWWMHRSEFNTHAEALAYADRMARTVGVTLPRVSNTTAADLQEIALTLLAHHYRSQP